MNHPFRIVALTALALLPSILSHAGIKPATEVNAMSNYELYPVMQQLKAEQERKETQESGEVADDVIDFIKDTITSFKKPKPKDPYENCGEHCGKQGLN